MTRSQSTIPFHELNFIDDARKLYDVEARWRKFLKHIRKKAQDAALQAGTITEDDAVEPYYLVANPTSFGSSVAPSGSWSGSNPQPACIISAMKAGPG
ncbi:MAG: hypothetical protein AAF264_04745 [Pseudomonadota bacterium]